MDDRVRAALAKAGARIKDLLRENSTLKQDLTREQEGRKAEVEALRSQITKLQR